MKKLIVYADGSCRPNPGFGGFGLYGYVCSDSPKNTYIKHPQQNVYFTSEGICEHKEVGMAVAIDTIVEHIESLHGISTNNIAELSAVIRAFELATKIDDLTEIIVLTDSEYVVNAVDLLPKWKSEGWKKGDGAEVTHKEKWVLLDKLIKEHTNRKTLVSVRWVKGHSGEYGNELADLYSVIGMNASNIINASTDGSTVIYSGLFSLTDYRRSYNAKDFILTFRDMFFSPNNDKLSYYFLSNFDKNNMNIGKRNVESIFAINVGYVPTYIDSIKSYITNMMDKYTFYYIKLSRLANKDILRLVNYINMNYLLMESGTGYSLVKDNVPFIVKTNETFPLTLNVSSMFTDMVMTYETLGYLTNYTLDVTPSFIDLSTKKIVLTNNNETIDLTEVIKDSKLGDMLKQSLILKLGYDLPSYLSLKSIEKDIQKVEIILDINAEKRAATCYVRIVCINRDIISSNITNKFLLNNDYLKSVA